MRFLTIATLTIVYSVLCLFALQTVLVVKADFEMRDEALNLAVAQLEQIMKLKCTAAWPRQGKYYDECLEKT